MTARHNTMLRPPSTQEDRQQHDADMAEATITRERDADDDHEAIAATQPQETHALAGRRAKLEE